MGNEENVIVLYYDNETLSAALPGRSLQAPSKENTSLNEHQHQTQESLPIQLNQIITKRNTRIKTTVTRNNYTLTT